MRKLPLILLLTLILAAAGCTSQSDRQLQRQLGHAEAIMEAHPDSALEIVQSLTVDSTTAPSLRARHALLLSQALDKNFIDLTSDSIIAPAVDYFTLRNDREDFLKTLFYAGRIEENRSDFNSAISDYIRAEAVAKEISDHFWLGKIYQRMGIILTHLYVAQEGLEFCRAALEEFEIYGDSGFIISAKYDLFAPYISIGQNTQALEISEELVEYAENKEDSALLATCRPLLATACYALGDFERGIRVYEDMLAVDSASLTHRDLYILSDLYTRTGDIDKADGVRRMNEATFSDLLVTDEYYCEKGDYKNAYKSLKWLADSMNRVIDGVQKQAANSLIRISRQNEIDRRQGQLRESNLRNAVTLFVSVAIIGLLLLLFISKRKEYRLEEKNRLLEIENYMVKVTSLVEESREREEHINALTEGIAASEKRREDVLDYLKSLNNIRFDPIDELLSTYYQYSGRKSEQREIYEKIQLCIARLRTDGAYIKEIEEFFNRNYDDMFVKLRQEPHKLSVEEIRLSLYLAAGFSTHAICLLISEKPDVFYNRKSRLKRKIGLYDTAPASQLLKIIG